MGEKHLNLQVMAANGAKYYPGACIGTYTVGDGDVNYKQGVTRRKGHNDVTGKRGNNIRNKSRSVILWEEDRLRHGNVTEGDLELVYCGSKGVMK